MKTKYISEDGSEFESKRMCKLYEESKEELETLRNNNVNLQNEQIGNHLFYKINSYAELWLFDKMIASRRGENPQSLYQLFSNFDTRFPVWFREDAKTSKKSMVNQIEERIDSLKKEISNLRDQVKDLKSLDSRSKSPLIESINSFDEETEVKEAQTDD